MFNIFHGSSAARLAYGTLRLGEIWFDTDDSTIYAGDGVTAGGVQQAGGSGLNAEEVRDTIGATLTDTATIDFTYTDAADTIEADVKDGSITNAKLANVATATIKGRVTAATGAVEDLSATNVRTIINVADGATAAGAAGDAFATSHDGAGGTAHAAASTSVAGFLSAADKTKLDGVEAASTAAGAAGDAYATSHESDSTAHAAANIVFTPAGTIAATTVQAAIEEVASEAGGATTLDELSDVAITTPAAGQVVRYSGTAWVNASPSLTETTGPTVLTVAGIDDGEYLIRSGSTITSTAGTGTYTDEAAQDAVGGILADTTGADGVNFTYDDGTPAISAVLATVATATIKGRVTAGTGAVEDLSATQARTLLNVADGATAYTDEMAQDAVGGILTDGTTINFTYTDATPEITAEIINTATRNALEALPPNIDTPSFTANDLVATRAMLGRQQKLSPTANSTFTLNTVSPSWADGEMIPLYNDSATYTVTITSGSVTASKASGIDTLVLNPKGYAWIEFKAADAALCDGNMGTVVTFTAAGKALVEAANVAAERAIIEAAAATPTSAVGTSRDVAKATDQGKTVVCSAAVTLTVTTSTAFDDWAECEVYAGGGIVTMAAGASITIRRAGSDPLTIPQYGSARLRKTGTSNEYVLHGTLA